MIFDQEVICGDRRFNYTVSAVGIEIIEDGMRFATIALSPGGYTLNGVPFTIE